MRNGCKVNFETREIIVTRKFLNRAETVGTEEFEILLSVGDFMSCRWSDFITGQQVASFFVIDSFL